MMDSIPKSLKEGCLSVILEDFERYHAAFKSSKETLLQKHLKYLERAFSETLFHRLISYGKLKAEYLDFLINPHVGQLNLEGIDEQLLPALLDRLHVVESNIVLLKAAFWNVSLDHYKQLISSVPNVEVIELDQVVHPAVLEVIGKRCPSLKVLKLLNCDIDDAGLKNIFLNVNGEYEDKVNLEQLNICSTMVKNDGVSFVLSHAPSLKCLEYDNVPEALYKKHKSDLENNCIEDLKKYSLTSLSFPWQENENLLDTLKVCVTLCPDVSALSIDYLENDEQLLLCSKFHHLKDLKIFVEEEKPFSFESTVQFLKLRGRGLYSLHLENGRISAEAVVEHCPKLRSLRLGCVEFKPLDQNKNLLSKAKLSNLKTLAITNSNFSVKETSDSAKLILSNAKSINSVNFSGAEGLTESCFRSIFQLGLFQLHELNLNSSDVTVPPLSELLSHGRLKRLLVANCQNITETEFFQLLAHDGDGDVTVIFSDNDSGDSYDQDYDYSDNDDYDDYALGDYDHDYYGYDFDDYDYNGYDFDDYDDFSPYDLHDDSYYCGEFEVE